MRARPVEHPAARQGGQLRRWCMPSGEIRRVDVWLPRDRRRSGQCRAGSINWGKAGWMRWKASARRSGGVVMNLVDHLHGGGEGKTSGGRHPVSPWGAFPRGVTQCEQVEQQAHRPDAGAHRQVALALAAQSDLGVSGANHATQPGKKGLFRRRASAQGRCPEREEHQAGHQDLVASTIIPDFIGHTFCGARRLLASSPCSPNRWWATNPRARGADTHLQGPH